MAAYAALVSLKNNMEESQRHTRLPICLDPKQTEALSEKVSFLIEFLEYHPHGHLKERKDLESRIIDAAYAAGDIIETHVVNRIKSHSRCMQEKSENKITAYFRFILALSTGRTENNPTLSCLQSIEEVLKDMEFIKEEVVKFKDEGGTEYLQPRILTTAPFSSSIHAGQSTMVGFNDELLQIMERLTGHQSSRQIISIVGMGGIGKTTLAKNAYENPVIVQNFYIRAWVSISQEHSLRQILVELLSKDPRKMTQMSENQLKDLLYKSLCGMRYLIVLDDMWGVETWEMIKMLFPNNNNGSRIIVTTRISSVAAYFDSSSLVMKLLDGDKSWELFCGTVFAREGCPLELEELGRKIVHNCKGLPISIVVIGGLLAKNVRRKDYWEYIAKDTKEIMNIEGNEHCMKVLSTSYHNLPIHLKPCILYMGVFPEDEEIRVSLLIKLWAAEGFLKSCSSKESEVVGEEYLNNLINRNLVLVHKRGSNGKVTSCMIHDLLRNICLKEAQNEKFFHFPKSSGNDKIQCLSSSNRITIHQSSLNKACIRQLVKILKSGSLCRSLICDVPKVLSLKSVKLLRVLKVSDKYHFKDAKYSLDDVFKLVNSRFIEINTIKRPAFPSSFCLLWNLQTLIVKGIQDGPIAPLEIWEMSELRHLQFEYVLYLPDPPSQEMNKRHDAIMKCLQTLKTIEAFRCTDEVVKRIPNIKKLNISYMRGVTGEFKEFYLKNLCLLQKLESLTCLFSCRMASNRPDFLSNLAFPASLKKLTLRRCDLHWEDMTIIGSLPHLEVLILDYDAFKGAEWTSVEGEFRCLKYLKISLCGLVRWISESHHFPCLEHLYLHRLYKLAEIPSSIGEIPTLRIIQVEYCTRSAVISAKKIHDEQDELGNEKLQVRVICFNSTRCESLASTSNNFVVQI